MLYYVFLDKVIIYILRLLWTFFSIFKGDLTKNDTNADNVENIEAVRNVALSNVSFIMENTDSVVNDNDEASNERPSFTVIL